jgi:hypothetical protein
LNTDALDYQPFYCEENVWRLNRSATFANTTRDVVFITSVSGTCPLFGMKAANESGQAIFWDYHVVLLDRRSTSPYIWDLDSTHGPTQMALRWVQRTLPDCDHLPQEHHPIFRVVPGQDFETDFSSDRSHMLGSDGSYMHPPPSWPSPSLEETRLDDYTSSETGGPGKVLSLRAFIGSIS